ncbi:hypothetical protein D3C75_791440 [compost metagenome]
MRGANRHCRADIVNRIHRSRRCGDVQRCGVGVAIRRGHRVNEAVRRFDAVRADTRIQFVGVVAVGINRQRAVFANNGGGSAGCDSNAVDLRDVAIHRSHIVCQHITRRRSGNAFHRISMILQNVQRVARQHGDAACIIEQEQVLAARQR